jgi:sugar lactone lactonase YvrE
MMKMNYTRLSLAAALVTVTALFADHAPAAVGDLYESNMGMVLRFATTGGNPGTFIPNLANPKGIVFDGNGQLYVADATRNAIYRFSTLDGTNGFTFALNLSSPVGLAMDVNGNLYSSDSGSGNVFKFNTTDGTQSTFASGIGQPAGLAFDSNGNLFAADFANGVIYKITPDGTKTSFATGLNYPAGLAVDSSNNLFEADSDSGTIFKFAPDGTKSTLITGLNEPYGIAFEATGNLVVADHGDGGTYRVTPTGMQSTIFRSDFNTPQFIAVEPAAHDVLNISTRGYVQGGDHILIAGFIIGGNGPVGTSIVVRALGPSLPASVVDPLPDPVLEIRDASGALIAMNDNWGDASGDQAPPANLQPTNPKEAALMLVLHGGTYTAIVYGGGTGATTGTALVEVYHLQ